jgi:protease IV
MSQAPPPPPYSTQPPAPYAPYTPYAAAPGYGYGYPPPQRRSGWFWVLIALGILFLLGVFFLFTFSRLIATAASSGGATFGQPSIAVVDINGVILDADKIDRQIERFGRDSGVKAIILHIDSPGGGAAASQEIYHEVLHVRRDLHKPVIASVESVGASGAYYISSACERIYANPASVVGSIGVIMEWTNYGDLFRWAKLKNVKVYDGALKNAGDPTRDPTPQEEAYFKGLVDNMYGQFIRDVAIGRHTSPEKIQPLATGQVWTGEEALPLGLIDKEGGFRVALTDTARQVGITGEPRLVRPPREMRGLLGMLSGDEGSDLIPNPSNLLNAAPGFYFLWK